MANQDSTIKCLPNHSRVKQWNTAGHHQFKIQNFSDQKSMFLYLCVSKQEDSVFSLHAGRHIKFLEILSEGRVIIPTSQLNLETQVSRHVTCQSERTKQATKFTQEPTVHLNSKI